MVELPAFSGLGVLPGAEGVSRACINDSTLHLSPDLCLSWYAGSRQQKLQEVIPEIIERIVRVAKPSKVLFAGGSGGGFASLFYASFFPESLAFVWNPQTDILRYNPAHVIHYAKTAFADAADLEQAGAVLSAGTQTSLAPLYQKARNHVLYLQNESDWHTERHLGTFLAELGLAAWSGETQMRPRENMHLLVGNWGQGHVPPPKGFLARMLRLFLDAPGPWSEIFADDSISRMIAEASEPAGAESVSRMVGG